MQRSFIVVLILVAACRPRTATIQASIPDWDDVAGPVPGLVVSFLPYNRDSILAALEGRADPRPHTRELDSLFQSFRTPFVGFLKAKARLDQLKAAGAPADSVAGAVRAVDTARAALEQAREQWWPAMATYRAGVRQWEDSTYRDYSLITRSMGERVFANPVSATTDSLGWTTITLTNGRWWATARAIDPADPNREWYWNVAITSDTVFLSPQTGRRRPRY